MKLEEVLPDIKADMLPRAIEAVEEEGVAYTDEEGDLVTTIIDGRNCAFSCYAEGENVSAPSTKPTVKEEWAGANQSHAIYILSASRNTPLLPPSIIIGGRYADLPWPMASGLAYGSIRP